MRWFRFATMGLSFATWLLFGCKGSEAPLGDYTVLPAPKVRVSESIWIGKQKYIHYCSPCHGLEGRGDGPNAPHLPVPPRNFTDVLVMGKKSDDSLIAAIRGGGRSVGLSSFMPLWGKTLTEGEIGNLKDYIRTFHVSQWWFVHSGWIGWTRTRKYLKVEGMSENWFAIERVHDGESKKTEKGF